MTTLTPMDPAIELNIVVCTEEELKNKDGEAYHVKTIYAMLEDGSNGYSIKAYDSNPRYDEFVEGATIEAFPNEDGTATFYRQTKYTRVDRVVAGEIKGEEFSSVSITPNDNAAKLIVIAHLNDGTDIKLSNFEEEYIKEDKTRTISLKYGNPTITALQKTIEAGELAPEVLETMKKSVDVQLTSGKTKAIERVMAALGVEDYDMEEVLEGVNIEDFEPWAITIGKISTTDGKVRFAKGSREI